jgi:hypothetical protein
MLEFFPPTFPATRAWTTNDRHMTETSWRIAMTVAAFLLLVSRPTPARAQEGRSSVASSYQEADTMTQTLEAAERKIRRGRAGLIASSLLLAGGTTTLALGLSDNFTFGAPAPQLVIPGAVAVGAGFIGVIISGVAVADGRRAKRRVERLRAQPELSLGPTEVRVRLRF